MLHFNMTIESMEKIKKNQPGCRLLNIHSIISSFGIFPVFESTYSFEQKVGNKVAGENMFRHPIPD